MFEPLKAFLKRPAARFLSAVVAVWAAFLLREILSLLAGPNFPEYLVFYPTVMIVALLAGLWPALLSTLTAAMIVGFLILPREYPHPLASGTPIVPLMLFVAVCVFLSVVAELYRRSRQKAAAYDKEQALRESQEAVRQQGELLKLSFDAILVRRMDGAIESWNRGAEELYGYTEEEALGHAVQELLGAGFPEPPQDIAWELRKSGQWKGELRHLTKDGREVFVSSRQHIGRGRDGRERVLEIDRDITERRRVQVELQRAHDELEEKVQQPTADLQRANRMLRMVSACDQALVEIAEERELMHVICQIIQDEGGYPLVWVGLAEDGWAGKVRAAASAGDQDGFLDGVVEAWGDDGLAAGPPGAAIRSWTPVVTDIALLTGQVPWRQAAAGRGFTSVAAFPLTGAGKAAFGALVIYSDRVPGFEESQVALLRELVDDLAFGIMALRARSERDQAQKALELKASQLQMLAGELVRTEQRERRKIAQLLHDQLQQLLAAALYGLVSLRSASKTPEFQESLTRLSDLLRECIEMSRSLTSELSHPSLSEPDLGAALVWLAASMKEKHGLVVTVDAPQAVVVEAEEIRIMLLQAARELLFNVVKHAGVKSARVSLSLSRDDRVRITVSDEGVGFDTGRLGAAGNPDGGIGLFSIRERLALTGGGMDAESSPGKGSLFTMWVPARHARPGAERVPNPPAGPAAPQAPVSAAGAAGKIRVLLVDDHRVVRNGLALQLGEQPDVEIVGEAADGKSAVELVRALRPDVVTMDVGMPGMSGLEATRLIHAEFPAVSVIGLSMFEEAEQAAAMREAGAVSYFSKSASFDILLEAIRACSPRGAARKRAARSSTSPAGRSSR